MVSKKIYYNTEYRKKIKALSKFNIFIKDRISKKDIIQEIKKIKKKILLAPVIYVKFFFYIYKMIYRIYNKLIYKKTYNLKLSLQLYVLKKKFYNENFLSFFFKNQLILEYFFSSLIYFFLILNWLWIKEWNKWASLTDILEYNFFSIKNIFQYINNNFIIFNEYIFKSYNSLLYEFFYFLDFFCNYINIYNIYLFDNLNIFNFLYNFEDIKLEHDKNFVHKNKWKDIKKISFDYLNLNILNNFYYLSFFSFSIYEYYIYLNKYNIHFITNNFFEYWIHLIIEKNVDKYKKLKKKFEFKFYNLKNIYTKIYKKKYFAIRVKNNLFLSNVDYFIFLKDLTFNFYIRNCDYFFEFPSQRKLFLRYNNPTSLNKGSLTLWNYDKLYKKILLIFKNNINDSFNLYKIKTTESFFNFYYENKNSDFKFLLESFFNNLNIKFIYKIKISDPFFFTISKFFKFNLMDFYNLKNKLESYKNVMEINSVYEYRYANSSFKTMEEFTLAIFKTPLENYLYFNDLYKNFSYNIIFNIFKNIENIFFFKDLYNILNFKQFKYFLTFFKLFIKLSKIKMYFFKFYNLFSLIENEEKENLLRFDVFYNFYDVFKKKKTYRLIYKLKKKNFYKKWKLKKFFGIIKYNSMFYLDIYSMFIYLSGLLYEIAFFFRFIFIVKIYNVFSQGFDLHNNYKYIASFKDFYFQLMYENIEYSLIYIFLYIKNIKKNKLNYINFINKRNQINNNFIYRKYTLNCWLEYSYYNDLFDDLDFFEKENYSPKLSKWILRYFYKKSELYMFYSESLINKYNNKNRLFI